MCTVVFGKKICNVVFADLCFAFDYAVKGCAVSGDLWGHPADCSLHVPVWYNGTGRGDI